TWKNTTVRLFTFAQTDENPILMKKDLERFLYHLRIEAQVNVMEIDSTEIEPYVYQRTMKMEERVKMLKEMRKNEKITDIQATMDEAVLERKYSRVDGMGFKKPSTTTIDPSTTTPSPERIIPNISDEQQQIPYTVARMHTALKLNQYMRERSSNAQLLVVNLPGPPEVGQNDTYYMEFIEALTEGLPRVLLVRGSGSEVVTIYS
uniref:SLC12A transporter C-terminal domain-containing protein n=1 Tax=Meloidogyne javanica TaxID=6303 RepID=A0A915LFW7_MELJA